MQHLARPAWILAGALLAFGIPTGIRADVTIPAHAIAIFNVSPGPHQQTYFGALDLMPGPHGTVVGDYRPDQTNPNPFHQDVVPVTGYVHDNTLVLNVGNALAQWSIAATPSPDGRLVGTATIGNHVVSFVASPHA